MSAPITLNSTSLLAPAPLVVLTEAQLRELVRSELAAVVATLDRTEPINVTLKQASERTGVGIHAIERTLRGHPELRLKVGTRVLVKWRPYLAWLDRQGQIDGDERSRKPRPRRARAGGGEAA